MPIDNPSLDSHTFNDLLNEARKNLPIYSKTWTNYNESDPGITLLELLCWIADNQIYTLNRITKDHYMKFLKLLGESPRKPTPAKLNVSFTNYNKNTSIPKGTKLTTRDNEIIFETDDDLTIVPVTLKKVLTNVASEIEEKTNLMERKFFYGFGKTPKTGNSFLLGFDTNFNKETQLNIGINLEENIISNKQDDDTKNTLNSTIYPSCQIQWKYLKKYEQNNNNPDWSVLDKTFDSTFNLTRTGLVSLLIPFDKMPRCDIDGSGDKLKWISCILTYGNYEIPPKINSIKLNTVKVTQGWTKTQSIGSSDGLPFQSFSISDKLINVMTVKVVDIQTQNSSLWNQVDTFDSSGPDDKHYTVDISNDIIRFGDGKNGDIPSFDDEIVVTYRHGTIRKDLDLTSIRLIPAADKSVDWPSHLHHTILSSGREPENIDEAIHRTRSNLRIPTKAVTLNDYEYIVKNMGLAVERVAAIPDSQNNIINVVVTPQSSLNNPTPSPGFLRTIHEHLNKHRLLTTQINVTGPNYVQVSVSMEVEVDSTVNPLIVQNKIHDSLSNFLKPMSGDNKQGWPFGRPVFRSEIYSIIKNIQGVQYMTKPYLQAAGKAGTFRYESGRIWIDKTSTVYSGSHSIHIRNLTSKNHMDKRQ